MESNYDFITKNKGLVYIFYVGDLIDIYQLIGIIENIHFFPSTLFH